MFEAPGGDPPPLGPAKTKVGRAKCYKTRAFLIVFCKRKNTTKSLGRATRDIEIRRFGVLFLFETSIKLVIFEQAKRRL